MNFVESTNFFVRTIMFDFINADPNTKLKFRVAPMIHIGSEEYYQTVFDKIKGCDEIFYEGLMLFEKEEKFYKKINLKNFNLTYYQYKKVADKLGLVKQNEVFKIRELKDKLTHVDFNPQSGDKAWRTLNLKEKIKLSLIHPFRIMVDYHGITRERLAKIFMTSNHEAYLAFGPREDEKGTARNFIMNEREQIIFQHLKQRIATESHLDKTIGIVYGAGHMNSIARYLIDQFNYVPKHGQFLKVVTSSEGFQHYSILFPEKKIGVLILSNSDNAESIFKELLEVSIGDIYTPWKWENYIPYNLEK